MDAEPSSGYRRSQNRPGMATVPPRASRWHPTPSAHRYRLARQGAAPTPGVAASHEKPVLSTLIRPSGHIPHAISTLLHADEAKTPQVVDLIIGGEGGIRTHVPLTGQDAFEAPPLRPLRYLSVRRRSLLQNFPFYLKAARWRVRLWLRVCRAVECRPFRVDRR
jgi:hypothetical protein